MTVLEQEIPVKEEEGKALLVLLLISYKAKCDYSGK